MSNDKPWLRFSTIAIRIVKIMVGGIIILQFLLSPTEDSLTHTTQESSSSVLGGFPVPQLP